MVDPAVESVAGEPPEIAETEPAEPTELETDPSPPAETLDAFAELAEEVPLPFILVMVSVFLAVVVGRSLVRARIEARVTERSMEFSAAPAAERVRGPGIAGCLFMLLLAAALVISVLFRSAIF